MSTEVLSVEQVTKKIGRRTILRQASFSVEKGSICGFIGANGAGKTTLMRIITGLMSPTSGRVKIYGVDVQEDRRKALMKLGAIIETPIFFPYMSGRDNLRNLAKLHPNLSTKAQKKKVEEVLEIVGLSIRADDKVKTYSLGMKQRLGIAQALLGSPELILLDEPANGLDPLGMRELRALIRNLQSQYSLTFLISSHLLDELQQVCDHLVIIRDGEILWTGTMEALIGGNSEQRLEEAFIEVIGK